MSVLKQFEHLRIRLEVIELATNNFSKDICIGRGGFGKVYRAELLHSNGHTMVALKRLDRAFGQGDSEFWKEVIMLSVYRHQHIVSLLGFCDEKGEKILVYEYAANRSLDLHLDNKDLTWVRRLMVCIGAARGLAYLHDPGESQQRVLHRDIKSSNILLDENWNARVADMGLSRFGPANQKYTFLVTNNTVGTIGYCDPLYLESGILTKESDVYSFGVVLFEVLCGRLCFGKSGSFTQLVRKHYKQNNLNEIIWGNIKDEIHPSSLKAFSTIAYQCLKSDSEKRPLMNDILKGLETALQYQLSTASMSTQTSLPHFEKLKREKVDLREHGRRHDQYKWLETGGVGEDNLVQNLPKDPRRDMKRHMCVDLVKRVPLFKYMNVRLLEDICQRLKPRLYTNNSYIIREGDRLDEMLFIIRGSLEIATTDHFFSSGFLNKGDFFGDELLIWAFNPEYETNFPSSIRTLKALRDVEAFSLPANELKFVVLNFKGIYRRHLRPTLVYYSKRWRAWATCLIQAAWAWRRYRYYTRKIYLEQWREEETELTTNNNAGGVDRTSYILRNRNILMTLQKPPYSNFTNDYDYKRVLRALGFKSEVSRTWAVLAIQAAWRRYSRRKVLRQQLNKEACNNGSGRVRTFYSFRATAWALLEHKRETERRSMQQNYSPLTLIDYERVLHASGFFSEEYRAWAACAIQAAWRRYSRRKVLEQQPNEEASNSGSGTVGNSYSFGATAWALLEHKRETERRSVQQWRE